MVWFGPRGHQRWCILVVSRPFPRFGGGIAEPDKEISRQNQTAGQEKGIIYEGDQRAEVA